MTQNVRHRHKAGQEKFAGSAKDEDVWLCHVGDMKNRIRALRKERKLTQEQLAELLDTDHSVISKLENGVMELRASHIRQLASAFGVHPGEILEELPADASSKNLQDEMVDRLGRLLEDNQALVAEITRIRAVLKENQLALQPRAALRLPPPARPPKKE